jgi:uncharacterized protein (TIGR02444 family)
MAADYSHIGRRPRGQFGGKLMPVSLWEFASSRYQLPGIAEVCLALQDGADADINMLLAAAWLASDGRRWHTEDVVAITQACRHWRSACLLPLRQIRRDLKALVATNNWYQRIKVLELEAERYQLRLIEDAVSLPATESDGLDSARSVDKPAAITSNLNVYLATLPAITAGSCRSETALLTQLLVAAQQG